MRILLLFIFLLHSSLKAEKAPVVVGLDLLFDKNMPLIIGKRIGLVTNHTAINQNCTQGLTLFSHASQNKKLTLKALFFPEHGLYGAELMGPKKESEQSFGDSKVYSLCVYGEYKKPTKEMLKDIDVLVFDLQDTGSRTYTYMTALYLVMEAAALENIPVIVLDRPNPLGGVIVDGPMLDSDVRSSIGYINVPYCHGMTAGELAHFFNEEYKVGCKLKVIAMEGWKRNMIFEDTSLTWIPTSPHIPESITCFHYATTGILGFLQLVNTGVWFSLPFKLVGAPWINSEQFAEKLNAQKYPGVFFQPHAFKPYFGRYKGELCHGVLVVIKDPKIYLPVSTQFLLMGMLKSLYPEEFKKSLQATHAQKELLIKTLGSKEAYHILTNEKERYISWKLRAVDEQKRVDFLEKRKKYLIDTYSLANTK
jgi:uncharacterized protein YbbC (DUF1343 family)